MLKTGSAPLDPYVRLIIDNNNDYVLEVMFNVPQECVPTTAPPYGPYTGRDHPGVTTQVSFTLDKTLYDETGYCNGAYQSVVIGNTDDSPAPTGGIIVVAAWDVVESLAGPETPGKTLIQFEDALDQRD